MPSLFGYEMKKICRRPFTVVVALGGLAVLLFIAVYIGLMETISYAWGPEEYGSYENIPKEELEFAREKHGLEGKYEGTVVLRGPRAIQAEQQRAARFAGVWDEARIQQLAEDYLAFKADPAIYTDDLDEWGMEFRAWSLMEGGMSESEVEAYNAANPIYQMEAEYQIGEVGQSWGQLQPLLEEAVIDSEGNIKSFAEAFPLVEAPAPYMYHEGPRVMGQNQGALVGVLALLLLLAGVSPIFSEEVSCHTEPMLLAAKYGRSRLVYAKIMAGLSFAALGLAVFTLVNVLASGLVYGFTGFSVPVQFDFYRVDIPFSLNFGQYLLAIFALQLLGLCAMAGLLLLLSLTLRSALPVIFAGGVFSFVCILFASQGNDILRALAQILPPGLLIPMLLSEGDTPGLNVLPLPQWILAVLVCFGFLAFTLWLVIWKNRRLQTK